MREETKLIHGNGADPLTGAVSTPIYQTSTFEQEEPGVNKGFDYARSNNPTRKVLEDTIARLESAEAGFAFSSGLAAVDAVLKLLKYGDEIIAVDDIYGGSFRLFEHIYSRFGIKVKYIDTTKTEQVFEAVTDKTKIIWLETPTNPTLKISEPPGDPRLRPRAGDHAADRGGCRARRRFRARGRARGTVGAGGRSGGRAGRRSGGPGL